MPPDPPVPVVVPVLAAVVVVAAVVVAVVSSEQPEATRVSVARTREEETKRMATSLRDPARRLIKKVTNRSRSRGFWDPPQAQRAACPVACMVKWFDLGLVRGLLASWRMVRCV
jgi:hypothetical protein